MRVSAKGKRNLSAFRRACLDGLELTDEIQDCNIPRGETEFYAGNMALLGRVAIRCKRLCRAINIMSREARRRADQ